MNILDFLSNDGYIKVNKKVIKLIGLEEAVILGELCSEYNYWKENNLLEDNMFYSTVENIEENTGLSMYQQRKAINRLEALGVISTVKKGLPAKRYIKINIAKLCEVLEWEDLNNKTENNSSSSALKTNGLDSKKFTTNKNNRKIINNKNKDKCVATHSQSQQLIKDSKDCVDIFKDLYDKHCPSGKGYREPFSAKRIKKIKYLFNTYSRTDIIECLDKAEQSSFLKREGFVRINWIIEPENFNKILEGNYDKDFTQQSKPKSVEARYNPKMSAKGKYDKSTLHG